MSDHSSESDAMESFSDDSGEIELTDVESTSQADILPYQFEPERDIEGDYDHEQNNDVVPNMVQADQARLLNTEWCRCGNCVAMPTAAESRCCREIERISQKMEDVELEENDLKCILDHPGFNPVCLNVYVLETAYYQYQQQYGGQHKTDEQRNRYTSYRQFVRWCWGYLGRRVRVPLPSCVVNVIHQKFPSPTYTGFKESGEPTEI
ncbi:uncharacterized protein [Argopecten irradians]|uniref:uncharacterized protein n=1 Tax=Argopecten irradians TaxID=31199 RepID=UPI00370FA4B7